MKNLILACTTTAMLLPAAAQAQDTTMSAEQVDSATSLGMGATQTLVLVVILSAVIAVISKGGTQTIAAPTTPMPF